MGLRNALDVMLSAGIHFMMFFRQFWDLLPLVVQMLVYVSFGFVILLGMMRWLV